MQNKYIILAAMYNYAPSFFNSNPSSEELKNRLLSFNPHSIPGAKTLTKKSLKMNYEISDKEQFEAVLQELMLCNYWDGPIYAILIDLFLNQPNDFLQLKPENVKETLSDFSKVSTYVYPFAKMNHVLKDEEHKQDYIEKLIAATADYFEEDSASLLQEIASLFQHNKDWLAHTKGLSWSAFNYSRAISIIADAAVADMITEQVASELCDYYGSAADSMFGDWQTFLFSAILGKQLLTPKEDRFILGANDYIEGCYKLAASPLRPLTISGVWPHSDCSELIAMYAKDYSDNRAENTQTAGAIDLYENLFLPIFSKHQVNYFLLEKKGDAIFYYMPTDEFERGMDKPYFDLSVEAFESELELGEFPIFSTDKCVFTNKNIRIPIKKLFRKKQSVVLPWNGPIDLKWVPSGLQNILLQVNGITILEIGPNLNRLGLSKTKTLALSKKETLELYKPDLDNLTKAIQELKQQLSV